MTGESDQGRSRFQADGLEPQQNFSETTPEQVETSQTAESNTIKINNLLTLSEKAHASNPDSALSRYLSNVPDLYLRNLDLQNKQLPLDEQHFQTEALRWSLDQLIKKLANPDAQIKRLSSIDPGGHPPIIFHMEVLKMKEIKKELQQPEMVEVMEVFKALLSEQTSALAA